MAPDRPFPLGPRAWVVLAILAAGVWAFLAAGLSAGDLFPSEGGMRVVASFFAAALRPATDGATLALAADAARRTVVFAAAAMSLALVLGVVLGFPASTAWWEGDTAGGRSQVARALRRTLAPALWSGSRALIALMRSVHELLWAVLFLAAMGIHTFAAVIAIAIPYGGILAKIWSEMIDETQRSAGHALRAAGASGLQVFCFALLPRALPDMAAYAFYRFECAVRASAVLGFFGYQTLGYHLRQAFDNLRYDEVWTYLYALVALVVVLEAWSAGLRRRFVGL